MIVNQKTLDRVKNYFQMILNRNFKDFKFRHSRNKNQIIYTSKKVKNDQEVLNLIDNFLLEKNSFIFESVEKGKIKVDILSLVKTQIRFGNLIIKFLS